MAKNHNLGQIWMFGGLLYQPPFTDEGQIWCAIADTRCTFTCQISSRSVYSVVLCWRKPPNFCRFWTSAFSDVANWQQTQKVEHGCTVTNLPPSNGVKIVSVLHRLHGEIRRTIFDVQKRDEQTDKQADKKLIDTITLTDDFCFPGNNGQRNRPNVRLNKLAEIEKVQKRATKLIISF